MASACARVLWREHKKSRRLRKWDSLPSLKLTPGDRPLFHCLRCQFVNAFAPICPWCFCACTSCAKPELATDHVPRRRISSPTLLSNAQKALLRLLEQRAAAVAAPCLDYFACPAPAQAERKARRQGVVYSSVDLNAHASESSSARTFAEPLAPLTEDPDPAAVEPDDDAPGSPSCSSTPMRASDATSVDEGDPTLSHVPISPITRTLRRQRGRLALRNRQRSSSSLRTRPNFCDTISVDARSSMASSPALRPLSPSTRPVSPARASILSSSSSCAATQDGPRLPYMAMRKNMAGGRRPHFQEAPDRSMARTPSPRPWTPTHRTAKSLDTPWVPVSNAEKVWTPRAPRPFSAVSSASSAKTSSVGYSASGLTELRIALARQETPETPGPYRYSFRDQESPMKRKVKSWGAGLRDFLGLKGARLETGVVMD